MINTIVGAAVALALVVLVLAVMYGIRAQRSTSGSGGQELHLATGTVSEVDYRDSVRVALAGLGALTECASLRGLSGVEAYRVMMNLEANDIVQRVRNSDPGLQQDARGLTQAELQARLGTLTVYQSTLKTAEAEVVAVATSAYEQDAARAGAIVQEECARVLH